MDGERMLKFQADREDADRAFRERESKANRRYRIAELILVVVTIAAVLIVAFIEKGGQPTINNIIKKHKETP